MYKIRSLAIAMLYLTLTALAIHACASPIAKKTMTDVEKEELRGKVKCIQVTYIEKKDSLEIRYDEHGFQVEYRCYFEDEDYKDRSFYKNSYVENGNMVERSIYNTDSILSYKTIIVYDKNGNEIESTTYDAKGYLNGKRLYTYDNKGNMIERCSYGSSVDIPPYEKFTYTYDSKGNMVGGNGYSSGGEVTTTYAYKYDNKGNRVEQNTYFTSKKRGDGQSLLQLEYDENGNQTKITELNPDGSIKSISTYKYDVYGNQMEGCEVHNTNQTESNWVCSYEYDEQGNWITKTYRNLTSAIEYTETSIRKIEYYK